MWFWRRRSSTRSTTERTSRTNSAISCPSQNLDESEENEAYSGSGGRSTSVNSTATQEQKELLEAENKLLSELEVQYGIKTTRLRQLTTELESTMRQTATLKAQLNAINEQMAAVASDNKNQNQDLQNCLKKSIDTKAWELEIAITEPDIGLSYQNLNNATDAKNLMRKLKNRKIAISKAIVLVYNKWQQKDKAVKASPTNSSKSPVPPPRKTARKKVMPKKHGAQTSGRKGSTKRSEIFENNWPRAQTATTDSAPPRQFQLEIVPQTNAAVDLDPDDGTSAWGEYIPAVNTGSDLD